MKEVKAYQAKDGKLFLSEDLVQQYEEKLNEITYKKKLNSFVQKHIQGHTYNQKNIVRALDQHKEELIEIFNQKYLHN